MSDRRLGPDDEQIASPGVPLTLESIYAAHFDFVYRLARRLGGPDVDAEDVAQDVFVVVSRKLDTYDRQSKLTTWLYGITLNVARSARRRRLWGRLFERHDNDHEPAAPSTPDRVEVAQAHQILMRVLEKMSSKKREAFVLFELEGLSCEEIADLVGTKPQTVWSRLHYARKELSDRLAAMEKRGGRS